MEQAFQALGEEVKAEKAPASSGSNKEHDDFVTNHRRRKSSTRSSRARVRGPSITRSAAYEGLVTMADAMGEDEVAKLLTENLEDEKAALRKIQNIARRLAEDGAKAARKPMEIGGGCS